MFSELIEYHNYIKTEIKFIEKKKNTCGHSLQFTIITLFYFVLVVLPNPFIFVFET